MYEMLEKIRMFFYNLSIPTVLTEYVIRNDLSYTGTSWDGKWIYYWEGTFKDGREVKVSAEEQQAYLRGRK